MSDDDQRTAEEKEQDLRRVVLQMAEALGDPELVNSPLDEVAGLLVGSMGDWTLDHKLYHMSCCYALALRMLHEGLLSSVQELNTPPAEQENP